MAKEILTIPEEYLLAFCDALEAGIEAVGVPEPMYEALMEWIEAEREYMADVRALNDDEESDS